MIKVQCNEGWKGLYQPLMDLCELKGNTVLQVKEKFGGLRFYWSGPYDITVLVHAAEQASFHTCEDCGERGYDWTTNKPKATTKGNGWIRTLCDPCRLKWEDSK